MVTNQTASLSPFYLLTDECRLDQSFSNKNDEHEPAGSREAHNVISFIIVRIKPWGMKKHAFKQNGYRVFRYRVSQDESKR